MLLIASWLGSNLSNQGVAEPTRNRHNFTVRALDQEVLMSQDNGDRRGRPDSVKVIEVIEVETISGQGTKDDPVRRLIQYWSFDGRKLAEYDYTPRVTMPSE